MRQRPENMLSRIAALYYEHRELIWLIVLAAAFRLFATLLFTQGGYLYDGHPTYDYQFYRRIGELSLRGLYPSIDYWLEYPPVFSYAVIGIYRLSLLLPAMRDSMFWFHNFLGGFLALADAGNLTLIYAIQLRLRDRTAALRSAWMYALLFWPLYVMLGWFDSLPVFFLLAAVWALASGRPVLAGLASGVGFMTKLIPALVAPVAFRAFPERRRLWAFIITAVASVVAIAAPFLVLSPRLFLAGFQSALSRSSWETIWALLEGYDDVGVVAPLDAHFDAGSAAWQMHPGSLPWPAITLTFVAIYGFALWRARSSSPRTTIAMAGVAVSLFMVFSKGYSWQFIAYTLPFIIILLPNGWGVFFALALSLTNLLQWPLYLMVFRSQAWLTWLAIGLRTVLWTLLAFIYFAQATGWRPSWLVRLRGRLALGASVATVALLAGITPPLYTAFLLNQGERYDLQQYLRPLSQPGQGVVLSSRDLIGSFYAFLDGAAVYALDDDWEKDAGRAKAELQGFAAGRPQTWLVLDYSKGPEARQGFLEEALRGAGARSTDRWFRTFRLVGYVSPQADLRLGWRPAGTSFGAALGLEAYAIPDAVDAGRPVRLSLRWQTAQPVDADYSLFVHIISPSGQIVAQRDKPLVKDGAGTRAWPPGETMMDAADLYVPEDTPPGGYQILAGLYRPDTGRRLAREDGSDAISLGSLEVRRAQP